MKTIDIQAEDMSLLGHIARAHVDHEHRSVTIGVTHATFDGESQESYEQTWNVHLDIEMALAWARALVAAIG